MKVGETASSITRILIRIGAPLEINGFKYDNSTHNIEEQTAAVNKFSTEVSDVINNYVEILKERSQVEDDDEVMQMIPHITYYSRSIEKVTFESLIVSNYIYIILCIAFVCVYMAIHIRSMFLAAFAMF